MKRTPMRKQSKKLVAKKAQWRKAVFYMWGRECFFCQQYACDPAHVIKASKLGTAQAYNDPRICRPLCRACHIKQESGLELQFPLWIRQAVTRIHNLTARVPLPIPED